MAEEGRAKGKQQAAIVSGLLSAGSLIPLLRAPLQVYFSSAKVFLPCKIEALFLTDEEKVEWCGGGESPSGASISLGKMLHFRFAFCWRAGLRQGSPSL